MRMAGVVRPYMRCGPFYLPPNSDAGGMPRTRQWEIRYTLVQGLIPRGTVSDTEQSVILLQS